MALPKGKYYSVKETAELLGISEKTIRRRIKSGTITAKKDGRVYQVYIPTEDLPKDNVQEEKTPPKDKKQDKPKEMSGQDNNLVDVLINQLNEKDELIKELNERIREAHVLASGRLLGQGKQEEDREEDGEIIYAPGQVEPEETKTTKDRKPIWEYIIYGLILLATFGLLGLMLIQSGIITL